MSEKQKIEYKSSWKEEFLKWINLHETPRGGTTKQELKGSALDKFLLEKKGKRWDIGQHDMI